MIKGVFMMKSQKKMMLFTVWILLSMVSPFASASEPRTEPSLYMHYGYDYPMGIHVESGDVVSWSFTSSHEISIILCGSSNGDEVLCHGQTQGAGGFTAKNTAYLTFALLVTYFTEDTVEVYLNIDIYQPDRPSYYAYDYSMLNNIGIIVVIIIVVVVVLRSREPPLVKNKHLDQSPEIQPNIQSNTKPNILEFHELQRVCSECNKIIPPNDNFCKWCGKKVR